MTEFNIFKNVNLSGHLKSVVDSVDRGDWGRFFLDIYLKLWTVDSVDSNFETSHLSGHLKIVVDSVDRGGWVHFFGHIAQILDR